MSAALAIVMGLIAGDVTTSYDCVITSVIVDSLPVPLSDSQKEQFGQPFQFVVTSGRPGGLEEFRINWKDDPLRVSGTNTAIWSREGRRWGALYGNCENAREYCGSSVTLAPLRDGEARVTVMPLWAFSEQSEPENRHLFYGTCKPNETLQ